MQRPRGLTKDQERIGWYVILSSLLVPLICAGASAFFIVNNGPSLGDYVLPTTIILVVGWPLAMIAIGAGAVVLGRRIRRGERVAILTAIVIATAFGAVVVPIVWNLIPYANDARAMMYAGAAAGLVSSSCFCALAVRRGLTPPSPA